MGGWEGRDETEIIFGIEYHTKQKKKPSKFVTN